MELHHDAAVSADVMAPRGLQGRCGALQPVFLLALPACAGWIPGTKQGVALPTMVEQSFVAFCRGMAAVQPRYSFMNDLADIAQHLADLFQAGEVPDELYSGAALRSPIDHDCCIQLRFQPQQQRWMLGVDRSIDSLDAEIQAQWRENLLRVGYASRWDQQLVGALDSEGRVSLVDCDFPGRPQQAAENATAQAIEGRLQAMLKKLDMLQFSAEDLSEVQESSANPPEAEFSFPGTSPWLKA